MRKLIYGALLPLFLLAACEPGLIDRKPVVRTYEADGFRFTFSLQTEDGVPATFFHEGESVVPYYTIENLTSDTAYIADFYSNPYHNKTFSTIYRLKDHKEMGLYSQPMKADAPACFHIMPHQTLYCSCNYPKDYDAEKALSRGKYYIDFHPRFAYYDSCAHSAWQFPESVAKPPKTDVSLPNMKIQFQVL